MGAIALLAGCAGVSGSSRFSEWRQFLEDTAPVCAAPEECDRMWKDAATFVDGHSDYKLARVEPNVIRTGPPVPSTTGLAWSIYWLDMPDGRRKIIANAFCANRFGCHPDSAATTLAFNCAVSRDAQVCAKTLPPRSRNRPDQQ